MAYVQCCVCRKRLSSPSCRSELIDSAWVVIFPGQKCIKKAAVAEAVTVNITYRKIQDLDPTVKTLDFQRLQRLIGDY